MGTRTMIELTGGAVEVHDAPGVGRPPLVWLHEGLGSIDLWRNFDRTVADRLGGRRSIVYSRHGYGRSAAAEMPRPVTYMHHEADVVLPELLTATGIDCPLLIGHSDGASIALLYAGAGHQVAGIVCLAPHVFVEPESLAGVEAARAAAESTDMLTKMGRYHDDAHRAFFGWNDAWRSPDFRTWNIEDRLGAIRAPVLTIQGSADQYGTVGQLDAIEAGVSGDCERLWLDGAGHAPHLDQPDVVADRIARFVTDRVVR